MLSQLSQLCSFGVGSLPSSFMGTATGGSKTAVAAAVAVVGVIRPAEVVVVAVPFQVAVVGRPTRFQVHRVARMLSPQARPGRTRTESTQKLMEIGRGPATTLINGSNASGQIATDESGQTIN